MASTALTVTFMANDTGNPPGKLADTELHVVDGPLDGLKLIGFSIWERRVTIFGDAALTAVKKARLQTLYRTELRKRSASRRALGSAPSEPGLRMQRDALSLDARRGVEHVAGRRRRLLHRAIVVGGGQEGARLGVARRGCRQHGDRQPRDARCGIGLSRSARAARVCPVRPPIRSVLRKRFSRVCGPVLVRADDSADGSQADEGPTDGAIIRDPAVRRLVDDMRVAGTLRLTVSPALAFGAAPVVEGHKIVLREAIAIAGFVDPMRFACSVNLPALVRIASTSPDVESVIESYHSRIDPVDPRNLLVGLAFLMTKGALVTTWP